MDGSELTANAEVNGWSPSPTQGQTTEEWLFTEYTDMVTHFLDFTLNLEGTYKSTLLKIKSFVIFVSQYT